MGIPLDDDTTLYTLSIVDDHINVAQEIDDKKYMTQDLQLPTGKSIKHGSVYKHLEIKITKSTCKLTFFQ